MLTVEQKSEKILNRLLEVDDKGNRKRTVVHWVNTVKPDMPIVDLEIVDVLETGIIILDIPKEYQTDLNQCWENYNNKHFFVSETHFKVKRCESDGKPRTDLIVDTPDKNRSSLPINIFVAKITAKSYRERLFDMKVANKMKEIESLYVLKNKI